MAKINNPTAINVLFTDSSLADLLPHSIVYGECYGHLNAGELFKHFRLSVGSNGVA
jgi:hypothetical protein